MYFPIVFGYFVHGIKTYSPFLSDNVHDNYRDILKDVQENSIHRGNLESLIKKNAFDQVIRLINYYKKNLNGFKKNYY